MEVSKLQTESPTVLVYVGLKGFLGYGLFSLKTKIVSVKPGKSQAKEDQGRVKPQRNKD